GTLRLDSEVDGWLPERADRRVLRTLGAQVDDTVPAVRPITLEDLLTFRLGFGSVMAPPNTYPIWRTPPAFPNAAGWLVSTIDDYWAFVQMLLNKGAYGDARVLSAASVESMTTDRLTHDQRAASRMFLGATEDGGSVCWFPPQNHPPPRDLPARRRWRACRVASAGMAARARLGDRT
ncbi:MAG TPA: hypothetical protein VK217_05785, partial [Acidimicrobiales bacterium]|nr:hypothetical protein [Acidimicrobiales bacterium]